MKVGNLLLLLLIMMSALFITRFFPSRHDDDKALHALLEQGRELEQTRFQLQQTRQLLAGAQSKLSFLNRHQTPVQVTAFTGEGNFANGAETKAAYAVPRHNLPEDKVLNIALSPVAQHILHARMNDYIVLLDPSEQKRMLARFVDTTAATEARPVIDVFFRNPQEARLFGRRHYSAVNISARSSPFQEDGMRE